MKQISFSQMEFAGKKRTTRRELFLAEIVESPGPPRSRPPEA